jgi:Xaa-Pro aminopeptidase
MELLESVIRQHKADAYVAFGSSQNADIRYLTHFRTEDPVLYIKKPGEVGTMVVGQMEYERAGRESVASVITRAESGLLQLLKEGISHEKAYAKMISQQAGRRVLVPGSFPYGLGHELESFCEVLVDAGTVASLREKKSPDEIRKIRKVQAATDIAMENAVALISASTPKKGLLFHDRKAVTSERIRALMHKILMDHGCHAVDTIVSCGKDSALPHVLGSGPLMESEPVVIDIFPTDDMSGYYTDMTRTVVKGEPSDKVLEMYSTVKEAQDLGMLRAKKGVKGSEVHQAVVDLFKERGYESNAQGFTHNLGHGVGLEVHELPTIGPAGGDLFRGNVITIEPGLYYRDIGGIRLENTGVITAGGFESFTKFPREFRVG